jgi:predicted RNA methylase
LTEVMRSANFRKNEKVRGHGCGCGCFAIQAQSIGI